MVYPESSDAISEDAVAAVVAVKRLAAAKSRMSGLPGPLRAHLARCMAVDTVAALIPAARAVLVVSDQADLSATLARHGLAAEVVPEPPPDDSAGPRAGEDSLNRALAHGDRLLRSRGYQVRIACVADLPALRTASVRRLLAASAGHRRCLLADHEDRGTTILIARGVPLGPRYGPGVGAHAARGSAERHRRSGAVPLTVADLTGADLAGTDLPDARWDVDTVEDLRVAWRLGLGPATAALLDPATGRLGRLLAATALASGPDTVTVEIDTVTERLPLAAYDGDPADLVPGRPLHALRVAGALRCWA